MRKQTRNAFEAWVTRERTGRIQVQFDRHPHTGEYTSPGVELAWRAYIAGTGRLSAAVMRLLTGKARETHHTEPNSGPMFAYKENELWAMIRDAVELEDQKPTEPDKS